MFGFIFQLDRSENTSWCHINDLGRFGYCIVLWRSFFSLVRWCSNGFGWWILRGDTFLRVLIYSKIHHWMDVRVNQRWILPFWSYLHVCEVQLEMTLACCVYYLCLEICSVRVLGPLQDLEWTMYLWSKCFMVHFFFICVTQDPSNWELFCLPSRMGMLITCHQTSHLIEVRHYQFLGWVPNTLSLHDMVNDQDISLHVSTVPTSSNHLCYFVTFHIRHILGSPMYDFLRFMSVVLPENISMVVTPSFSTLSPFSCSAKAFSE